MNLPTLDNIELRQATALVRADLDIDPGSGSSKRLEVLLPTLNFLFERDFAVILMGHRGRPEGKFVEDLSMKGVSEELEKLLEVKWGAEKLKNIDLHLMENLRFEAGEEACTEEFATKLAEQGDIFVNDAFAASHRKHGSIVELPKLLPHFAGIRMVEEVNNLSKVRDNPERPAVVVMGGAKQDKLEYIGSFETFADKILVGGRLPAYMEDAEDEKLVVANLNADSLDITLRSAEKFVDEIEKAKTIVLAGPMGKFEEEGQMLGTKKVFEAVVNADAFRIAGGGDTIGALEKLGLEDKLDWVSVGGGASLEFLAHGTLPGIEALLN